MTALATDTAALKNRENVPGVLDAPGHYVVSSFSMCEGRMSPCIRRVSVRYSC